MSKTEKANSIMAVFTERYGSQAEQAAKAGASGLQQLNKAWGEIQETIGAQIGPFMAALAQLLAGKGLEATSGAAATGMQKTVNDYVAADAEGRKKIVEGLQYTLDEYTRLYKEAKDRDDKINRGHYAAQKDVVREALEKIGALNKESTAQITEEDQAALEAKRKAAADQVQIAKEMYQKLETLRLDQIDMSNIGNVGNNLFSTFDPNVVEMPELNIEPIEIPVDVQKFNEDLAKVAEDMESFIEDMNTSMEQFTEQFIGAFGEGIGQLMSGNIGLDTFFNSILGMFGDFVSQMGKMLIAYGVGMSAFKKAFTNPFAAIAAGIALTVIGGMISGLAAKGPTGGGGASTAGMSGGGSSSGMGGGYGSGMGGELVLTTEISGSNLRFVLQRESKNSHRIGI